MEILFVWVIMGVIVGMIASSKERGFFAWFLYGLLIWPIALVHILISKPVEEPTPGEQSNQKDATEEFVDIAQSSKASESTAVDELTKLAKLLKDGHITQAEFDAQKAKLLAE